MAWVEDQRAKAESFCQRLGERLGREGLSLEVEWICSEQELQPFLAALGEDSRFDLILVDWKLGSRMAAGSKVCKLIRDQHSFADIIFYSAADPKTLRGEIAAELIDGVWCVNRTHFVDEAWHILKASLRRLDLNALRGLYMASVADFDHQMKGALIGAYEKLASGDRERFLKELVARKLSFMQRRAEAVRATSTSEPLAKVLDGIDAGSFDLMQAFQHLNGCCAPADSLHRNASSVLGCYEADVLTPRNDLAHARSVLEAGVQVLKRSGRSYKIERFAELRTSLLQHSDNLRLLCDKYLPEIPGRLGTKNPESSK